MRPLALLLLLALLVAGCVAPAAGDVATSTLGGADPPDVVWARVREAMAGVPCAPEADAGASGTTANLRELARVLPGDEYSPTFHAELTVRKDERGSFALHARTLAGGFDVLDLDDPLAPAWRSAWVPENESQALDVKLSTDGATAIVGSVGSLLLVDVRDLDRPVEVGRWDFPREYGSAQGHMLAVRRVGEADFVFAATQMSMGVWILRLAGPPEARTLEPVSTFSMGVNGPIAPHDQAVVEDPLAGTLVMYVANGFMGWLAADVSDPASPKLLGGLPAADPTSYAHSIAVAFVDGKRLVVTSAEAGHTALKVYDATDLRLPVLVAQWKDDATQPFAVQHNVVTLGSRLYLSHWERGAFVFDLADVPTGLPLAGTLSLRPVARFSVGDLPNSSFLPFFTGGESTLNGVLDVVALDGVLYVATIFDGLYVVGDGCLPPGDPLATTAT